MRLYVLDFIVPIAEFEPVVRRIGLKIPRNGSKKIESETAYNIRYVQADTKMYRAFFEAKEKREEVIGRLRQSTSLIFTDEMEYYYRQHLQTI